MKIRIIDITGKERVLEGSEEISLYPALVQMQSAGECTFLRPVETKLALVSEFGHIRLNGSVATAVRLHCSRCLAAYEKEIASRFTIYYRPSTGEPLDDEVELGEDDLISATYSGDELDFSDEIAEQLMLEIPYKPLCAEECAGLCPTCGVDLNTVACNCSNAVKSLGFSPLQGFKVKS